MEVQNAFLTKFLIMKLKLDKPFIVHVRNREFARTE